MLLLIYRSVIIKCKKMPCLDRKVFLKNNDSVPVQLNNYFTQKDFINQHFD